MSKVTFNIGDHSSFDGRGADGSLNFLVYPDSGSLGLVLKDSSSTYGFQVLRPIFGIKNTIKQSFYLIDNTITSSDLLKDFMQYKVSPIFCELSDTDDSNVKYTFYYLQNIDSSTNRLTFYNPIEKIKIIISGAMVTYQEDEDDSILWTDF